MNDPTSVRPEPVEGPASTSTSSVRTGFVEYVKATAALLDLPLDDARAQRVAGHLALSAALAQALEAYPLPPEVEPAEVFCPAPFGSGRGGPSWP